MNVCHCCLDYLMIIGSEKFQSRLCRRSFDDFFMIILGHLFDCFVGFFIILLLSIISQSFHYNYLVNIWWLFFVDYFWLFDDYLIPVHSVGKLARFISKNLRTVAGTVLQGCPIHAAAFFSSGTLPSRHTMSSCYWPFLAEINTSSDMSSRFKLAACDVSGLLLSHLYYADLK